MGQIKKWKGLSKNPSQKAGFLLKSLFQLYLKKPYTGFCLIPALWLIALEPAKAMLPVKEKPFSSATARFFAPEQFSKISSWPSKWRMLPLDGAAQADLQAKSSFAPHLSRLKKIRLAQVSRFEQVQLLGEEAQASYEQGPKPLPQMSDQEPSDSLSDLDEVFGDSQNERAPAGKSNNKSLKIKSIDELQELTPHESVSIIQKRYLPKTFRGEFNFSITSAINHTYFYLAGARLAAGWFLREDHGFGIEGIGFLPAWKKNLAVEMEAPPNGICVSTNVFSKYYLGLYYKWSPVFGKFSLTDSKIIYFDMYLTVNGGMSKLFQGPKEECPQRGGDPGSLPDKLFPSGGLGLGQIFALSQNWAFNWDLKWNYTMYEFEGGNQAGKKHDMGINLLIGFNYYFPGAGYR